MIMEMEIEGMVMTIDFKDPIINGMEHIIPLVEDKIKLMVLKMMYLVNQMVLVVTLTRLKVKEIKLMEEAMLFREVEM